MSRERSKRPPERQSPELLRTQRLLHKISLRSSLAPFRHPAGAAAALDLAQGLPVLRRAPGGFYSPLAQEFAERSGSTRGSRKPVPPLRGPPRERPFAGRCFTNSIPYRQGLRDVAFRA